MIETDLLAEFIIIIVIITFIKVNVGNILIEVKNFTYLRKGILLVLCLISG
jgi:hypothetical protein